MKLGECHVDSEDGSRKLCIETDDEDRKWTGSRGLKFSIRSYVDRPVPWDRYL